MVQRVMDSHIVQVADTWVNVPRVRVADTKEGLDAPRVQEDGTRDGRTSGTDGWN